MTDYQIRELIKAVKEISIEVRDLRRDLRRELMKKTEGKKNENGNTVQQ